MQLTLDQKELIDVLSWDDMIEAIDKIFKDENVCSPVRHHHFINVPGEPQATLLLMPAWVEGKYLGVKQVNVFPGNNAHNLPGLSSSYMLSCGLTGQPLLITDANELTSRRTAAASALASRFLSREDSRRLLMVGAGRMARRLISAHLSVRPIERVDVWNHKEKEAIGLVDEMRQQGIDCRICSNEQLPKIAAKADIISCATLSKVPLILGGWLKKGTHIDLVGSFTPDMREVDNDAISGSSIFVDTRDGVLSESGELIIPMREDVITASDIVAEFSELCHGQHKGRSGLSNPSDAITLFKSVGDSREDLAAAILAYSKSITKSQSVTDAI